MATSWRFGTWGINHDVFFTVRNCDILFTSPHINASCSYTPHMEEYKCYNFRVLSLPKRVDISKAKAYLKAVRTGLYFKVRDKNENEVDIDWWIDAELRGSLSLRQTACPMNSLRQPDIPPIRQK